MRFGEYKSTFEGRRASFEWPSGTRELGIRCDTRVNPEMPPWILDWAIIYPNGHHFRVKETYRPRKHPRSMEGERMHFCFQYGRTTGFDIKGMPRTVSDLNTVIRIDHDKHGPHMHYKGIDHILQEEIGGDLIIDDVQVFDFVTAVEEHRKLGCSMDEILRFSLRERVRI